MKSGSRKRNQGTARSKDVIKEVPKQVGEEVIILTDEVREFQATTGVYSIHSLGYI